MQIVFYNNTAEMERVDKTNYLNKNFGIFGYLKNSTTIVNPTIVVELKRDIIGKLYKARTYLEATDYIVIKLAEALANGDDLTELKTIYAEQLAKRKEYRASIDTLQVELNALNEELKTSEEAKNDESIEDVIEQPVEEIPNEEVSEVVEESPSNTSEVVEEMPSEEVTEVTEVEPSEQPIKETPTEVVENLE